MSCLSPGWIGQSYPYTGLGRVIHVCDLPDRHEGACRCACGQVRPGFASSEGMDPRRGARE